MKYGPGSGWQKRMLDFEDEVDINTNWAYVSSFPLRANITLIDPSSVDRFGDPVDSCIINCNCNDNIVSAECDLFSKCEKCDPKKRNVKWIMDSGASMAFTSNAEACRRCVIS